MKILLIAGHGQGDPGACSKKYREAELTREVVDGLCSQLCNSMAIDVFDISKNMYTYLSRGGSFDFKKYDYVLEVHFNAGAKDVQGNSRTTGTEMLVHSTETGVSVEEKIVNNLSSLGFKNRGVKRRSDLLNMNICKKKQGVSYGLLEVCFIDDADDMALFEKKKSQVIQAICKGVTEGFGITHNIKNDKKLESANDITWELNYGYFPIADTERFVKALMAAKEADSPLYWGYYKLVNKIK